MENHFSKYSVLVLVLLLISQNILNQTADGRDLRPSEHGLADQESTSKSPGAGNSSSSGMLAFFGVSPASVELPAGRNFTASWMSAGASGRSITRDGKTEDPIREGLFVGSLVCGLAGVVLVAVSAALLLIVRFRKQRRKDVVLAECSEVFMSCTCKNKTPWKDSGVAGAVLKALWKNPLWVDAPPHLPKVLAHLRSTPQQGDPPSNTSQEFAGSITVGCPTGADVNTPVFGPSEGMTGMAEAIFGPSGVTIAVVAAIGPITEVTGADSIVALDPTKVVIGVDPMAALDPSSSSWRNQTYIMEFLAGKSILITGATGFLAKVLVEKILRTQPDIKKLFLLIRASDSESARKRFHTEVLDCELFRVLRDKYGGKFNALAEEKVFPVAGDISFKDLGIENADQILEEVDFIINSAATTVFDERYDVAMSINTLGAINVLNFAKKCLKLNMIVHVSTAYVCGDRSGSVPESPFRLGDTVNNGDTCLDIDEEKRVIEEKLMELKSQEATDKQVRVAMKILGIERAKLHGWPNTYSFTKAMGEMLLLKHKENLCVVTLRPTIITSTYKEPFPGWIEGARTMDIFVLLYGKGKANFMMGDPDSILDAIPGDMVVNSILAAVAHHGSGGDHHQRRKYSDKEMIYHVGSSSTNPLKILDLRNYLFSYFTHNPWTTKTGEVVKVSKPVLLTSLKDLRRYISIRYLPIITVLKLLNVVLFHYFEEKCVTVEKKINLVMRIAELYKPYLFFYGSFDETNTRRLRKAIAEKNMAETLYFDAQGIVWEDYFNNTHIPGVVKYAF
ncbi:unnamed protein product [Cuscuta campestris]|uniref:Fatty acyl-CoA reductase n=1 Tax=Cuscuta campestris TaxID=132261 RepID=A0A484L546_9ASTE|nr:unnamed protein product [Cuscuta campestris]